MLVHFHRSRSLRIAQDIAQDRSGYRSRSLRIAQNRSGSFRIAQDHLGSLRIAEDRSRSLGIAQDCSCSLPEAARWSQGHDLERTQGHDLELAGGHDLERAPGQDLQVFKPQVFGSQVLQADLSQVFESGAQVFESWRSSFRI